jgi:hypothetical protein
MTLWKNVDNANSAPVFTTSASTGNTGKQDYGSAVIYVHGNEGYGVAPGWTRKTVRGSRTYYETLVVIGAPV